MTPEEQIALLKEKLVEERAWRLLVDPAEQWRVKPRDMDCDPDDWFELEALRQLRVELPEVNWE